MAKVTISQIKKLRSQTGAPIIECQQALKEAGGKLDKAKGILRKKGMARAAKKADRATSSGLVETYVHSTGKVGAMVELCCETDFVARTDEFKNLAHELAMQVASMNPKNVKALMNQEYIRDPKTKVRELVKETIGKLGENIVIRRFKRFKLGE